MAKHVRLFICLFFALQMCHNLLVDAKTLDELVNTIFNSTDSKELTCPEGRKCVQHHLCRNSTINEFGGGIIDIRLNSENSQCPHYLETCCEIPAKPKPEEVTSRPDTTTCGHRNVNGIEFTITGAENGEAEYGEFPWMIALLENDMVLGIETVVYKCGGSIIKPSVVLTAAHCVFEEAHKPKKSLIARAGEWDTQTTQEVYPHQDRVVIDIDVHKNFQSDALLNDIALLYLKQPFEYSKTIGPLCLPPANLIFDHAHCYVSGWGKDHFGQKGTYQVILKKIDLPVVPHSQCEESLRKTKLSQYFHLHDSFICAGGIPGKDVCKGDGGSPLICPMFGEKNRYYQAGIVAWGIGCGQDGIPGVYTNVPHFVSWIEEQLNLWRIFEHRSI